MIGKCFLAYRLMFPFGNILLLASTKEYKSVLFCSKCFLLETFAILHYMIGKCFLAYRLMFPFGNTFLLSTVNGKMAVLFCCKCFLLETFHCYLLRIFLVFHFYNVSFWKHLLLTTVVLFVGYNEGGVSCVFKTEEPSHRLPRLPQLNQINTRNRPLCDIYLDLIVHGLTSRNGCLPKKSNGEVKQAER